MVRLCTGALLGRFNIPVSTTQIYLPPAPIDSHIHAACSYASKPREKLAGVNSGGRGEPKPCLSLKIKIRNVVRYRCSAQKSFFLISREIVPVNYFPASKHSSRRRKQTEAFATSPSVGAASPTRYTRHTHASHVKALSTVSIDYTNLELQSTSLPSVNIRLAVEPTLHTNKKKRNGEGYCCLQNLGFFEPPEGDKQTLKYPLPILEVGHTSSGNGRPLMVDLLLEVLEEKLLYPRLAVRHVHPTVLVEPVFRW